MQDYRTKTIDAFHHLTPSLKRVAEHLLQQPVLFAQEAAAKVAKEISVSETTVIRFSTAIGYKGYSELQREIRNGLYSNTTSKGTTKQPFNEPTDFIHSFLHNELKQTKATIENVNPTDFQEAIEKICHADRILISGSYNSYSMAHWLWYNLGLTINKVHLFHPGTDNINFHLSQLGKNSLLIACSFHRYALDTIWLSEEAKKKGVYTISVTDSPIAPIIRYSDIPFLVEANSENSFETSPTAAYSILHLLVTGVEQQLSQKDSEDCDFRLKKFFV